MIKADDSGELPDVVLVLPEHDELRLSHVVVLLAGVVEAVRSDLDCAIVRDWINLKCSGNELSRDFAADVVPDAVEQRLTSPGQAGFVMVELEVFGDQGCDGGQVAVVVGVEEFGVQGLNDLEEGIGCGARLRAG